MIQAIDPKATIRYVPKCERDLPVETQTVFLLRPLTARDAARMQDDIAEVMTGKKSENSTMKINSGSNVLRALELGLAGWENFKTNDGKDVEWRENNGKPRPEMFDCLPADIRRELAEVIIEGRDLTESSAKN